MWNTQQLGEVEQRSLCTGTAQRELNPTGMFSKHRAIAARSAAPKWRATCTLVPRSNESDAQYSPASGRSSTNVAQCGKCGVTNQCEPASTLRSAARSSGAV